MAEAAEAVKIILIFVPIALGFRVCLFQVCRGRFLLCSADVVASYTDPLLAQNC